MTEKTEGKSTFVGQKESEKRDIHAPSRGTKRATEKRNKADEKKIGYEYAPMGEK